MTTSAVAPGGPATRTGMVFWLPVDEAARHFEVQRDQLVAAVRGGELEVRAKVIRGEVVASVSSAELEARFGAPRAVPLPAAEGVATGVEPAAAPEAVATSTELDELHGRLVEAEDRARVLELDHARLEGRLETADRIERGLQRYADKLEDRLDATREDYEGRLADAEQLRLNLARVVGRMETEMLRLQARLDTYEGGDTPAQLTAGEPPARGRKAGRKKRRWFRRG